MEQKRWLYAGLATAIMVVSMVASAAPLTPFNAAQVNIFAPGPTEGTTLIVSPDSPVFAERGAAPGPYGKARAVFGSNGFAILSGAAATSGWSDGFLITGGAGASLVNVSVDVHGSVVGSEADMSYTLFASANPFDLQAIADATTVDNQNPMVPGADRILHTEIFNGQGPSDVTLIGTLPFVFGQTFYLASVFLGDVCGLHQPGCTGGSEDFFSSTDFGITAPPGAALSTLSGTTYAAAVPEPATWCLLCAGLLAILAVSSRRTRQQNAATCGGARPAARL